MQLKYLQALPAHGISYDTETYAIVPGNTIPKIVVSSGGWLSDDGTLDGELLDKEQAAYLFAQLLDDPEKIIGGANITFDLNVMARHAARMGVDIMPQIFKALMGEARYPMTAAPQGRVFDILLAEALNAIAEGHLGLDPRTMGQLRRDDGRPTSRYSLFNVIATLLGREDAKLNDEWRKRYGELDGIPIAEWPDIARTYPVDDARNTAEAMLAQAGHMPKVVYQHAFDMHNVCQQCGAREFGGACRATRPHRNLHDLSNQVGTQYALQLGGAWGFRVNQANVDIIERESLRGREGADKPFIDLGILRPDGSQDLSRTKKLVAEAFGATEPCPVCEGTGKIQSPNAKVVRCRECRGHSAATKLTPAVMQWKMGHPNGCKACGNKGEYKDPKHLVVCHAGTEPDPEDPKKTRKIKTCDGTGYLLTDDVPRSEKEGVGYGRSDLNESGDDKLVAFAAWDENKKDLDVYVPFFRRARTPVAGHGPLCTHIASKQKDACICPGPYKDIPLTLSPNTIVETGRVSYDGVIQLLKRASGYINELGEYIPSLRECIEARGPRYEVVEVPDDYVLREGEEIVE